MKTQNHTEKLSSISLIVSSLTDGFFTPDFSVYQHIFLKEKNTTSIKDFNYLFSSSNCSALPQKLLLTLSQPLHFLVKRIAPLLELHKYINYVYSYSTIIFTKYLSHEKFLFKRSMSKHFSFREENTA